MSDSARVDQAGRQPVPVPDGTWVLRGGDLTGPSKEKNLRNVYEAYGLWGICVAAQPGKTVDEIAQSGHFGSRNMMMALSEDLVADGFEVVREPGKGWPSALILVSGDEEPDGNDWERLRVLMMRRGLAANPRYRGK